MKKLMVLAAVAAMALGAKATEYYTTLAIFGYYTDDVSIETRQSYTKAYVVLSSALADWDGTVAGLSGISTLKQYTNGYDPSGFSYFGDGSFTKSGYDPFGGKSQGDLAAIIVNENDAFVVGCTEYREIYSPGFPEMGNPESYKLWIDFSNESSPYAAPEPTPVPLPEPTSGLLLLLGMAGLALKRKLNG